MGDRYRIEGLLGSGGTSNVYLAVDTRIGQSVVVKQLNNEGAANSGLRERFLAEAKALSNFQHPRIVRILDFAAPEREMPYLVAEALVGEPLSHLLRRRPLLPKDTVMMIARQTAQGLAAAHRRGVVHRDIKPGNLFLIGPRGAPFGLKIIDFGMATLENSNDRSGVHTVLGTTAYMAPEQVLAEPVDGRTDIYSFGIVLFRMVTGRPPFKSEDGIDLFCHQLYSPVPSPSWFDSNIDPRVSTIVLRATRKDPQNRYPNIRSMIIDLDIVSGLCRGDLSTFPPIVTPDRYEPRNEKGREVAMLLAERHAALGLALDEPSEELAAYALTRPATLAPRATTTEEFEELSEEDLEALEN